jgi:hypothetical protein
LKFEVFTALELYMMAFWFILKTAFYPGKRIMTVALEARGGSSDSRLISLQDGLGEQLRVSEMSKMV